MWWYFHKPESYFKKIKKLDLFSSDVELEAKKNPRGVIRALDTYLQGLSDKHGGNTKSGETGHLLEFAGVHELEVEDD